MCLVMSTSQGRRLQRRLSLTIRHCLLALVMRNDTPRPQVLEHGLHDVVCVTQFSCQVSFPLEWTVKRQATLVSSKEKLKCRCKCRIQWYYFCVFHHVPCTQSRCFSSLVFWVSLSLIPFDQYYPGILLKNLYLGWFQKIYMIINCLSTIL